MSSAALCALLLAIPAFCPMGLGLPTTLVPGEMALALESASACPELQIRIMPALVPTRRGLIKTVCLTFVKNPTPTEAMP